MSSVSAIASQPLRRRPALLPGGFFFFLLAWPVFWSNAKVYIADDPLHLVRVPPALRFVEPLVLLGGIAGAVLFGQIRASRDAVFLRRWIILLLTVGGLGAVLSFPGIINLLYGIYAVCASFILLLGVLLFQFDGANLTSYRRYLILLCIVNGLAGIYQVATYGLSADFVHGFFEDANVLANVFYFVITYLLFSYAATRMTMPLVTAAVLMPIAYFAFDEKLNVFFLLVILPAALLRMKLRLRTLITSIGISLLAIGATVAVASRGGLQSQTRNIGSFIQLRGGLLQLGVFKSYALAWNAIKGGAGSMLFGLGPSNYGGSVASHRYNLGTATAISNDLFAPRAIQLGALDSPVNFYANVLGEFGIAGCVCIAVLLLYVLRRLRLIAKNQGNPNMTAWAWAAFWGWLMVMAQAAMVPFATLENLMVMTPIAVASGVVMTVSGDPRGADPATRSY